MSHIVGNFISSSVLKPDENQSPNWKPNANCGAKDCPFSGASNDPSHAEMSLRKPQMSTVYLLCAIYVILGASSVLLVKALLREYPTTSSTITTSGRFDLLVSTITHMKDKNQLLIIPVTLWMGFSLAFMGADFTKSFVACTKG